MSEDLKACPQCGSPYGYFMSETKYVCPECAHEWDPTEPTDVLEVKDANGKLLQDGDTVIVIKDLDVKGASAPIKVGTKVKNIRLRPGPDHNIDCKVKGFGAMLLTAKFVKKA